MKWLPELGLLRWFSGGNRCSGKIGERQSDEVVSGTRRRLCACRSLGTAHACTAMSGCKYPEHAKHVDGLEFTILRIHAYSALT